MNKINELTLNEIMQSEGLRLEAYPDPGSKDGKPVTIGYGTTKINGQPIKLGTKITKEQAKEYFRKDIEKFAEGVASRVKVPLNDNQFGALVSFAYNVGIGAFGSSTLLKRLNAGDYKAVPGQLARWNKNDGKVMKGLISRRKREADLWNTPVQKPTQKPVQSVPEPETTPTPEKTTTLLSVLLRLIRMFLK
jgi:lysozyme